MRSINARLRTLEAREAAEPVVTLEQARAQLVAAVEQARRQPCRPVVLTGVHAALARQIEVLCAS